MAAKFGVYVHGVDLSVNMVTTALERTLATHNGQKVAPPHTLPARHFCGRKQTPGPVRSLLYIVLPSRCLHIQMHCHFAVSSFSQMQMGHFECTPCCHTKAKCILCRGTFLKVKGEAGSEGQGLIQPRAAVDVPWLLMWRHRCLLRSPTSRPARWPRSHTMWCTAATPFSTSMTSRPSSSGAASCPCSSPAAWLCRLCPDIIVVSSRTVPHQWAKYSLLALMPKAAHLLLLACLSSTEASQHQQGSCIMITSLERDSILRRVSYLPAI